MFRNFLKTTIRNFIKEKFYALTNVFGLAIGIATSLLILIYISHEISYDEMHPEVDKTYRVNMSAIWSKDADFMGSSVIPLAEALKADFPEIESTLRINTPGGHQVTIESGGTIKAYDETQILAADSTFFDFFGLKLKEGDPATALAEKNTVVLSSQTANKYFGNDSALGKVILLGEDRVPVRVTGVTEKHPTNIHFDFDLLFSIHTNPNIKRFEWSWIWTQVVTYVKLRDFPVNAEDRLDQIATKYAGGAFQRLGIDMGEFENENGKITFQFQPVKDIHLKSKNIPNRIGSDSDIAYVYIFASVAFIVLILASINFMNLTTARASNRAKEIGVKKVLGSTRRTLIMQFLTEATLMSLIATVIGIGGMELMRFMLIDYLDLNFEYSLFDNGWIFAVFMLLPVVLGLVAGSYPAFYMTSFRPANVLKGNLSLGMKNSGVRNMLVIFQFTIAIALIACTAIVYKQLHFFKEGKVGFAKENVLKVHNAHKLGNQIESFRNELANHPDIESVSIASLTPGFGSMEDFFYKEGFPDEKVSLGTLKGDEHYIPTMKFEMVSGRNFSIERPSDKNAIILNQVAAKQFGWDEQAALGKVVQYYGEYQFEVIGVVKDFYNFTLRYNVPAMGIFYVKSPLFYDKRVIAVKCKNERAAEVTAHVGKKWAELSPDSPYTYSFIDEDMARMFKNEEKLGGLFTIFAVLGMIIACIGLFGLASYVTTQRNKEIGIRKVLGATTSGLVFMLNSNFSRLIVIAILLAVPISWFAMDYWLKQFNNKIVISWDVFVLAGISAFAISWSIVGYQSLRAALLNPADTLKDE